MNKNIVIILIAVLAGLSACKQKEEQAAKQTTKFTLSDSMQRMIRIDTASYCNIDDEISLSGEVGYNENNVVKIFPRSSGVVLETKVTLGDKVTKGQVLAIIRSADIAGDYSDLSSSNADVAIAKRQLDNTESLYKNGISSEREYTEAKQNYEKALAARHKVQSVININSGGSINKDGEYILKAPIDGYIVDKKISSGSYIRTDNTDNIFTISDLKNVWVNASVYEADIAKVKEGYNVRVVPMAYPDKMIPGKIAKVSQVLDPLSKVMIVRIPLENTDMLLKPDMFAKVLVSNTEDAKAICIPTAALVSQDGKEYVVVYNSNTDLHAIQVNIMKTVNDKTYITSGIRPGQKLVTENQLFIFNQLMNN